MAVIEELIRKEEDGTLSFGNYLLSTKSKVNEFEHCGDLYKVKTYYEITKLEKNGLFVYESVPGTAVSHFRSMDREITFTVEGKEDAQITLELEEGKEYEVSVDGENAGTMRTNLGGKLVVSVELDEQVHKQIRIAEV